MAGEHRWLFRLMYLIGKTPWDGHPLPALVQEIAKGSPKGKALDVGCGTGDTAIYLAQNGWDVTGIDFVARPLRRARAKAEANAAKVAFVQGDVTKLTRSGVGDGFGLVVDNGCMHGLSAEARAAYVQGLNAVTTPDARMVLSAFPRRKRPGPEGIDREEVIELFAPEWTVSGGAPEPEMSSDPDDPIHVFALERAAAG
jgi:2-polyprenyl-3-methyl-5-hydroxy-6-metoxy-1,4-benzoquinol methylase